MHYINSLKGSKILKKHKKNRNNNNNRIQFKEIPKSLVNNQQQQFKIKELLINKLLKKLSLIKVLKSPKKMEKKREKKLKKK